MINRVDNDIDMWQEIDIMLVILVSCIGIHCVWRFGVVPNFLVLKVFRNYGRGEGGPKSATKYGAAQFKE